MNFINNTKTSNEEGLNQYICIDCNMVFDEKPDECNVCNSNDIVLASDLNY